MAGGSEFGGRHKVSFFRAPGCLGRVPAEISKRRAAHCLGSLAVPLDRAAAAPRGGLARPQPGSTGAHPSCLGPCTGGRISCLRGGPPLALRHRKEPHLLHIRAPVGRMRHLAAPVTDVLHDARRYLDVEGPSRRSPPGRPACPDSSGRSKSENSHPEAGQVRKEQGLNACLSEVA